MNDTSDKFDKAVAWWSGGVTSAVACKIAINIFGSHGVRIVFIDTKNEHSDTFRFMKDCEKWYGINIETITNEKYNSIQEVWYKYKSLNISNGASCSLRLKMEVRFAFQKAENFTYQVFGFDIDEAKRIKAMTLNYRDIKPVYPLAFFGYTKQNCISILGEAGIEVPMAYKYGLNNNNCLQTGCVQGGIGYWQKMRTLFPDKFLAMSKVEHDLTDLKGEPVTMLKDQSKGGGLVFLLPHPLYPNVKDISMMKGMPPKPLVDCNGYCGTNDLTKSETEKELNYAQ